MFLFFLVNVVKYMHDPLRQNLDHVHIYLANRHICSELIGDFIGRVLQAKLLSAQALAFSVGFFLNLFVYKLSFKLHTHTHYFYCLDQFIFFMQASNIVFFIYMFLNAYSQTQNRDRVDCWREMDFTFIRVLVKLLYDIFFQFSVHQSASVMCMRYLSV